MRRNGEAIETRCGALALGALSVLALAGCHGGTKPPPPMGPPEVGVVRLEPQSVTLTTVLPGRTSPYEVADVRPQVNGIILSRLFVEGSNVKAGQPLYQIDPAPYQAAYAQAKGVLASAVATVASARVKDARYGDLVKIQGVARQDYDDAHAAYLQALAAVEQDQAALRSAKINLDYTRVTAPISGRIGRSAFTKGALVTASQANALSTIQTLDPIYVDVTQSAQELLQLEHKISDGGVIDKGPASVKVGLKLVDGRDYPLTGRLKFADVTVDPTTGAVALRAIFPNPSAVLLPGLYVRAEISQGTQRDAILAPQQGVARDQAGAPIAQVVNAAGKAETRKLTTQGVVGDKWLVTAGLKAGDLLIVEGLQKVHEGMAVRAVAAGSPTQRPPPARPPAVR